MCVCVCVCSQQHYMYNGILEAAEVTRGCDLRPRGPRLLSKTAHPGWQLCELEVTSCEPLEVQAACMGGASTTRLLLLQPLPCNCYYNPATLLLLPCNPLPCYCHPVNARPCVGMHCRPAAGRWPAGLGAPLRFRLGVAGGCTSPGYG